MFSLLLDKLLKEPANYFIIIIVFTSEKLYRQETSNIQYNGVENTQGQKNSPIISIIYTFVFVLNL